MTSSSFFAIVLCLLLCSASWAFGKRMGQTQTRLDLSEKLVSAQTQVTELRARLDEQRDIQSQLNDSQNQALQHESINHQRLMQSLMPINEGMRLLQTSVTSLERQHAAQLAALGQQLQLTRISEERLRQSADELSRTLSHSPLRGTWGEAQLRSLVETAGLLEHVHFNTQVSLAQRTKRPDMLILLPEDKCIPIDSKVPLSAFLDAQGREEEQDKSDSDSSAKPAASYEQLMVAHAQALRRHVTELAKKEYWKELPYSADYVIAFIPAESILSAALRYDPSLMHDALEMNVVLASPTSMWAILRTVSFTWRQENLSSQANEIIQLSQELYERLQTLGKHATKVSSALNNASQSWNSFLASFESRALVSARKLSGLSAETQPIDTVKVEARSLDDDLFERNQLGKSPETPTCLDPTENLDTPTESIS